MVDTHRKAARRVVSEPAINNPRRRAAPAASEKKRSAGRKKWKIRPFTRPGKARPSHLILGFALYTGTCQFLSAGPLQMVLEHCVACRFETLGLDRNMFDHRIENLFLFSFLKTKLFHFIFLVLSSIVEPSEITFSYSRCPCP